MTLIRRRRIEQGITGDTIVDNNKKGAHFAELAATVCSEKALAIDGIVDLSAENHSRPTKTATIHRDLANASLSQEPRNDADQEHGHDDGGIPHVTHHVHRLSALLTSSLSIVGSFLGGSWKVAVGLVGRKRRHCSAIGGG